jgi:hypothetical protein
VRVLPSILQTRTLATKRSDKSKGSRLLRDSDRYRVFAFWPKQKPRCLTSELQDKLDRGEIGPKEFFDAWTVRWKKTSGSIPAFMTGGINAEIVCFQVLASVLTSSSRIRIGLIKAVPMGRISRCRNDDSAPMNEHGVVRIKRDGLKYENPPDDRPSLSFALVDQAPQY